MRGEPAESFTVEGLDPSDPRRLLVQKCGELGIEHKWDERAGGYLSIGFPNGREKRWIATSRDRAQSFLNGNLGEVVYLGDFDACLFRESAVIEASVGLSSLNAVRSERSIFEIPGIKRLGNGQPTLDEEAEGDALFEGGAPDRIGPGDEWVLPIENPQESGYRIELGTASDRFLDHTTRYRPIVRDRIVGPRASKPPTLRLMGVSVTRHDEALALLKRISDSLFFEIDLRFDVALRISPGRPRGRGRRRRAVERGDSSVMALQVPRAAYDAKPLSLYWYARSSIGLPLLEFLAYYQVLEYYFPTYSRRDTLDKLRHELRDPRFEIEDDAHLSRLLNLAAREGKGYGSERDQLKATIKGCLTEDHVRGFLGGDSEWVGHFEGSTVKDVARVHLKDQRNDLLNQVANRVYDIRCRIVHTKEDGGDSTSEILLPFSKEAASLGPDVELVKFLAQKCLIAGSSKMHG